MTHTLQLDGQTIEYTLTRKRVKNINLRIRPDGHITVSAPRTVPQAAIETFLRAKSGLIQAALRRVAARIPCRLAPEPLCDGVAFWLFGEELSLRVIRAGQNGVCHEGSVLRLQVQNPNDERLKARVFTRWADETCRSALLHACRQLYPCFAPYGAAFPQIRMRDMISRWGSCIPGKGIVTFSKRLLCVPPDCVCYVAAHELCHLVHPNHSKAFYGLLTAIMPDWPAHQRTLERYSARG